MEENLEGYFSALLKLGDLQETDGGPIKWFQNSRMGLGVLSRAGKTKHHHEANPVMFFTSLIKV